MVVTVTRRSAEILDRLAKQNPKAFDEELAISLYILGSAYSRMGKPHEALGPAERAAEIFQRLDKQTGTPLEEGSAHNLKNLGGIYWKLGRPDDACRVAQRAREILERLTKSTVASPVVNPAGEDIFQPQATIITTARTK
jgi:tetratricopeptide (TPR) repeat protein